MLSQKQMSYVNKYVDMTSVLEMFTGQWHVGNKKEASIEQLSNWWWTIKVAINKEAL